VSREPSWTTPSELAEYTFCPRAAYYRRTEAPPPTPASEGGIAFHRRRLGAERWRDEHRLAPWVTLLVGAALLGVVVLVTVR